MLKGSNAVRLKSVDPNENLNYGAGLSKLTGRVIVRPDFQAIITYDGEVLTRGENKYGELGNGERTPSDEWCKVEGLENVVGIYASTYFGDYSASSNDRNRAGDQHCYALTADGKVYRWGANILNAEEVTLMSSVNTIEQTGNGCLIFRCAEDKDYIMMTAESGGAEDKIIPYHSLQENETIYPYMNKYILLDEQTVYFVDFNLEEANKPEYDFKIQDISFEECANSKIEIEVTSDIKDISTHGNKAYLLTEEGRVLSAELNEDNSVTIDDLGGMGYQKIHMGETTYGLFYLGNLECRGDNLYGQLGDGTYLEQTDGFVELDEHVFWDFNVGASSDYIYALDSICNIWAWGRGFESVPQSIISVEDFLL